MKKRKTPDRSALRIPPLDRINRQLVKDETGCWTFTGWRSRDGYGYIKITDDDGPRTWFVHRWMYEQFVGPIPIGLQIDHLCLNKACCNPAHLEAVTQTENMRRANTALGIRGAVTHCPKGHPYDEANTIWRKDRPNCRDCRACGRIAQAAYYKRRKVTP